MKCGSCKKEDARKGKYLCENCAEQYSGYRKREWKDKKALLKRGRSNLCTRCSKNEIAEGSKSRCKECLEYARMKQSDYR